jgi:hypothetical protein
MTTGYEPGQPDPRDVAILGVLQDRGGRLSEVQLKDGRLCKVWNIAWGYDAGDTWSHITTNISPEIAGQDIDFFFTHEVHTVQAPESADLLVGPDLQ